MAKPEYIERGAAKHAADLAFDMTETEYDILCKELDRVPAADVAPVVHGHFVHDGPRFAGGVDWWHCSSCGRLASGVETRFDYCPNCGAKMDLEADDNG